MVRAPGIRKGIDNRSTQRVNGRLQFGRCGGFRSCTVHTLSAATLVLTRLTGARWTEQVVAEDPLPLSGSTTRRSPLNQVVLPHTSLPMQYLQFAQHLVVTSEQPFSPCQERKHCVNCPITVTFRSTRRHGWGTQRGYLIRAFAIVVKTKKPFDEPGVTKCPVPSISPY